MFKLVWVLAPTLLLGQGVKPTLNQGKAIYISNCSFCHGGDGEGGRGPNLSSGVPLHGATDADLRRVIAKGIPGTPMPSFALEPDELTVLVRHIRNLRMRGGFGAEKAPGDPVAGKQVYAELRCASCHRIEGQGSVYGPDLTRVGGGRSLRYLREAIVDPSADVLPTYKGVVVTTLEGTKISGVRINEDTFSVQLRNIAQQFLMFQKEDLKAVTESEKSLMPSYTSLNPKDLDNLVAYLASLKTGKRGDGVRQADGIR